MTDIPFFVWVVGVLTHSESDLCYEVTRGGFLWDTPFLHRSHRYGRPRFQVVPRGQEDRTTRHLRFVDEGAGRPLSTHRVRRPFIGTHLVRTGPRYRPYGDLTQLRFR